MQSVPPVAGAQREVAPPGASLHPAHWVPAGQSRQPVQAAPRQATSQAVDNGGASSNFDPLLRRYEEEAGTGWHYLLVRLEPPLGATDNTRTHLHHPPRILELALVGHGAARPAAAAGDRAGNCTGKSRTSRSTGLGSAAGATHPVTGAAWSAGAFRPAAPLSGAQRVARMHRANRRRGFYRSYTDAAALVVICQNSHTDRPTHKQNFVRRCQETFCSCAQHRSNNILETCLACLSHKRLGASRPSRLRRRGRT